MNFVDPILYQAHTRPHAPAIIMPDALVRYGQLDSVSYSIATHLLDAGVAAGDVVAISFARKELSILVSLALARIGAVSVANPQALGALAARRMKSLGCEVVCHFEDDAAVEGVASLVVRRQWLTAPARFGPLPSVVTDEETPLRVAFSSGTTGSPKLIRLSHGSVAQRVIRNHLGVPAYPDSRLLLLARFDAGFSYHATFKHLFAGGAIVIDAAPNFARFAAVADRFGVTQAVMSTFDLMRLLDSLPPTAQAVARTGVTFAGGSLAAPIWRRAAKSFAGPVLSDYGATEHGPMAIGDLPLLERHPNAVGRVLPWVRMQAVDDEDRPLPVGEQGILRACAPGIAQGYVDDPAATASAFKNGWFYPGDVGMVTADGVVCLVGRRDDVMNIGGAKISSAVVESLLAGRFAVRDVAVIAAQDPGGQQFIGVGVVADKPIDCEAFAAHCRDVTHELIPVRVFQLDEIPRNEAGKILRQELAARLTAPGALRPGPIIASGSTDSEFGAHAPFDADAPLA